MRVVELEGVENVRDLGGIPVAGGLVVKPGLIYRGGALPKATDSDRKVLFADRGICCVVDLRCGWEVEAKPNRLPDEVEYLHIPFYDLEKVGIDYTEKAEGTKSVGSDFACVPSHFYHSMANRLTTAQMRDALDAIFGHAMQGEPVYFHCSGGKDRAGIMALLVLTVLGANRDAILDDYLLTNDSRDKHYDELFERFLKLSDGDEQRAHELVVGHRALAENLEVFYKAVDEEYGSWDAFMRGQLAMDDSKVARIRKACTARI